MDVTQAPLAASQTGSAPTAAPAKAPSSDFTTFLKLLTAQLKNQDPLKPLDSTQFVAQLASFSSVEQQVKTNQALAGIQNSLGGPSASNLSSWIGAEVRAEKDANFAGSPIDVYVAPNASADMAKLTVSNSAGIAVQEITLPAGNDVYTWAGVGDNGAPLPADRYSFKVDSLKAGDVIGTNQASIYETVREARIDAGRVSLVFADGQKIFADDVSAVRNAASN